MACGACQKRAAQKDCKYIYTDSKGQQQVYTTEVRAMAAKVSATKPYSATVSQGKPARPGRTATAVKTSPAGNPGIRRCAR